MEEMQGNDKKIPVIYNPEQLQRYGVCQVRIPTTDTLHEARWQAWAEELSQVTPEIMAAEGDGEYAFYRNILQEPDFPFEAILQSPEIGGTIMRHFGVKSLDEIRLDDAFCIQYNMAQEDTTGAKHMDPSDITVNMCLQKSDNVQGSQVLFHGTKALRRAQDDDKNDDENDIDKEVQCLNETESDASFRFLVEQKAGCATLHWGNHPHETTSLEDGGTRTNIVLTYCYVDGRKSDVASRTCYI